MAVAPADVIRVTPPTGSDHALATNRDHTTGIGLLTPQDLSVTTSGRLGVWMGHRMIVGECSDHGEVADEAAMLALHDWADDPHTRAVYHYVAPGDSCTRADDPGYRWHCLTGHGRYLTDWERRPLAAPIAALESRADAMEVELAGKIGSSALDGYVTDAALTDALDGKANSTHTHTLSQLTQSGAATGQVATWTGSAWAPADAGGGGGASFPAGAVDGQMIVADSTADGGVRWTGVSVLPAPNNGAGVLVSNGQAWYALSSPIPGSALVLNQAGIPVWATVAGISYDPNAGQPQITGTTLQCTYSAGGDGNGIFYALGTNLRRQAWANPVASWPKIGALDSNNGTAGPTDAAGRTANSTSVMSTANTWCAFDLGQRRQMAVTDYTYRTGAGASYALRNWKLQGSNNVAAWNVTDINAATWVDIDTHANDATISTTGYYRFACNGDTATRFRFLRLVMTGVNANNDWRLIFGNLEFYGPCTLFQFNIPAGVYALNYSSDGDGNGLVYFLGSVGLTKPFQNPVWAGDIAWMHDMPTAPGGDFPRLFDHVPSTSQVTSGGWVSTTAGSFVLDLGVNRTLSVTRYSLFHSYSSIFPRNWKLQGIAALPGFTMLDANAAVWTDIDVRVADTTIGAGFTWGTFVPNGDTTTRYRYLRWLNTGANSGGGMEFRPSELEFYGTLEVTA